MKFKHLLGLIAILLLPLKILNGQDCSHGATHTIKGNKLYLYFATAVDANFPQFSQHDAMSNPLHVFDVADLDAGIGTTDQLRNRIFEIVTEDFCEFNVEVELFTNWPSPQDLEARWQIVGLGTDDSGIRLSGEAMRIDINDRDSQDYARVYAGTFEAIFGDQGGVLNGANSTLERWATVIGSTTSHEAAHNYGVAHSDAAPRSGEGAINHNIMATVGQGLTDEDRTNRRHFNDISYEILAHNIGLNIMSLYNWDFVNPNAQDAHSLEMTLLSSATTLTIEDWYNGTRSPWRDPTISSTGRTRIFQDVNYNEFILNFSRSKNWVGGSNGVVPGGAEFHVGAGFGESELVFVYDTKLKDSNGSNLSLHPRMANFDRGVADLVSGNYTMTMSNPNDDVGDLLIEDLNIQYLPRLASIYSMVDSVSIRDVRGTLISAHGSYNLSKNFELGDNRIFHLGNLKDKRFVDIIYDSTGCKPGINNGPFDVLDGEVNYCPHGNALSLFPSTTVYVTATIIDPNARYYDQDIGNYVNGPLKSKVFYQFAGIVPDFNENGIDDLIDIREGTSLDINGNGVPDEVNTGQPSDCDRNILKLPCWVYLIWVILIIIIIILYIRQRNVN